MSTEEDEFKRAFEPQEAEISWEDFSILSEPLFNEWIPFWEGEKQTAREKLLLISTIKGIWLDRTQSK